MSLSASKALRMGFQPFKKAADQSKTKLNRILWFAYPHKIFELKSLCTTGVNLNEEIAENFFILWIFVEVA